MLDTFVECSSLKSFTRGIEVAKVRYFLGNFTPQLRRRLQLKIFPLRPTSCLSLIHVYMVNDLLDNLIHFSCSQFQMHSDPLKY